MLRIAVPNKGSLSEPAADMLREAGYRQRRDSRELVLRRPRERRRVLLPAPARHRRLRRRRHRSTPASPAATCCSTPAPRRARSCRSGSGESTFRFAARPATVTEVADLAGRRIATSYPGLVERLPRASTGSGAASCGSTAPSRPPSGSASPTSSPTWSRPGRRCATRGWRSSASRSCASEAVLVRPASGGDDPAGSTCSSAGCRACSSRGSTCSWTTTSRSSSSSRRAGSRPAWSRPTVSPLHDRGWVAVRAMVPRGRTNQVMDELYDLGARAILVTDIHACRL